jgi:hypothetical protein
MATNVSVKGHLQSTAMCVSSWHSSASECLYSLCNSQTRHGTARHDHAVLCATVLLQWISFLKKSSFHVQKCFQFTDFLFLNTIILQVRVTCLQTCVLHFVTLPYISANERVALSYGGVINILCNVDVPETKFLGKYLLNLYRAMCSTAHNHLESKFHCSKFSIK